MDPTKDTGEHGNLWGRGLYVYNANECDSGGGCLVDCSTLCPAASILQVKHVFRKTYRVSVPKAPLHSSPWRYGDVRVNSCCLLSRTTCSSKFNQNRTQVQFTSLLLFLFLFWLPLFFSFFDFHYSSQKLHSFRVTDNTAPACVDGPLNYCTLLHTVRNLWHTLASLDRRAYTHRLEWYDLWGEVVQGQPSCWKHDCDRIRDDDATDITPCVSHPSTPWRWFIKHLGYAPLTFRHDDHGKRKAHWQFVLHQCVKGFDFTRHAS